MKALRIRQDRPNASSAQSPGRRRFLSGIGATGLATSAAVFGSGATARASNYQCCNLAIYPPNVSYEYCSNHANYIWACTVGCCLHCMCCETDGGSAGDCPAL